MEVAYLLNNKYRVHEVAKDFKKNSKEITDILTKYATAPKNHMQVLEDRELSLIFEYLTQHNQVDNIESIYAEVYREPKAAPAPKGEPAKAAPQAQKPAAPAGRPAPQQPKGKPQPAQQPANRPATRVPEKKVVDTRKGGQVNLEKYDERLENLAAGKTKQMQAGKQKFQGRNQRKGGFQGSKRRQEEQEKMRRLQLEIAKKTPLTVKIPDAIGVGELASRMKKTGAEVVKTLMKNGVMASLTPPPSLPRSWAARWKRRSLSPSRSGSSTPPRTRRRIWSPAPPWWWSWATSTTARPPCWTISATPTWRRARPAASPSTSVPIR